MTEHDLDHSAFQLDGEYETATGWLYTFSVERGNERKHHELTLSWVDHEHLVNGAIAPERVAFAAFGLAVEHFGASLPERFDVSSLRRHIESFDERSRSRINAPL